MKTEPLPASPILLLVAGAKGAVGSTLAAAVAAGGVDAETLSQNLTTRNRFSGGFPPVTFQMAGWDVVSEPYPRVWEQNSVLPEALRRRYRDPAAAIPVREAPEPGMPRKRVEDSIREDLEAFQSMHPGSWPVLINLLPAAPGKGTPNDRGSGSVSSGTGGSFPDAAYALAAVKAGIPVVNFTPNALESDTLLSIAAKKGVPVAGRDGKTGQTFFKVVLASAMKARALNVQGWYSLNLLGNADGKNLMIPENAAGKLANKTAVLDAVFEPSREKGDPGVYHKVRIDYYPPRGDAKEAWDLIDFSGLFGLPMSLRVNLMGRDSILAAPMILDLARWMTALKAAGWGGPVPELAFYFKTPVGAKAPSTFQEQLFALDTLEERVMAVMPGGKKRPA